MLIADMSVENAPGTSIAGLSIAETGRSGAVGVDIPEAVASVTAVRPVRCPVSTSQISNTDFSLSQTSMLTGNSVGEVTVTGVQVAVGATIASRRPSGEKAADVSLNLSRSQLLAKLRGSQFHVFAGVSNSVAPSLNPDNAELGLKA
jgi:hypothetical protein